MLFDDAQGITVTSNRWSDRELERSIELYVETLKKYLHGTLYTPKEILADLLVALPGRSERSVHLRMNNISSVLFGMKFPLLSSFPPAHHVGSGVEKRIVEILHHEGIGELADFAKCVDSGIFEKRVSNLRRRESLPIPTGSLVPASKQYNSTVFFRDPAVKAWILKSCGGICEGCNSTASFTGLDGLPYLEVHHVIPLSKMGSDTVTNAVALCPNCHRRCHLSLDRDEFRLHLYETVARLLVEVPDPVGNGDLEAQVFRNTG